MNKKVDFSIANKISRWRFGETFFHFLVINIALLIFFAIAVVNIGEKHTNDLVERESYSSLLENRPSGITRTIVYERGTGGFWDSVLIYRVWSPHGDGYAAYDYDFSETAKLTAKFFAVLLVIQLILLFSGIGKSRRVTRSALRPIAELTETARNINKLPRNATELKDIAGKLDLIDADKLETRITVESNQKELSGLAEAINGMLDRINESYNSQMRFVSDASHELRTPIAVIQGYANLLDRWGKNDEKALQESIDTIKSEAQNMKDLVEKLLFLARGDNESMRLNLETINISGVVSEVVRETEMISSPREIFLNAEPEILVYGDGQLIKQALRILLDNSIKYTPVDESINISLTKEENKVKIAVSDNGIGIPPEDLPHIFDRFFRSDDSRARKTGGSGLGLSIAKWIIENHGGSFEVISREDIGTRITLTLDVITNAKEGNHENN